MFLAGRKIAQAVVAEHRGREAEKAQSHEHAAPVENVGDHAGRRCAQQIAGDGRGQQPADHDLALRQRHEIGDQRHADREAAAAGGAGDDAQHEQQPEARHHRRQE
jgi:hypothetical protein